MLSSISQHLLKGVLPLIMHVQMCLNAQATDLQVILDYDATLPALQVQSFDSFHDLMKSAALFGMPKLLACCEHHVAFTSNIASFEQLRDLCRKEPLLDRSQGRINKGLSGILCRYTSGTSVKSSSLTPCACVCCTQQRKIYGAASCRCLTKINHPVSMGYLLPSPKGFLKMATDEVGVN